MTQTVAPLPGTALRESPALGQSQSRPWSCLLQLTVL